MDEARIKKVYLLGWILFGLDVLGMLLAYYYFPEDRKILKIFLVATMGPVIATSAVITFHNPLAFLKRLPFHKVALSLITLVLIVRAMQGERQDLYLYFLFAMGPLLYASNRYAMILGKKTLPKN